MSVDSDRMEKTVKIVENVILSRNNPLVKLISSLSEKKNRNKERLFIAEGEKLTLEAIKAGLPIKYIAVCESRSERIMPLIKAAFSGREEENIEIITFADTAFEKISTEKAPEGVITVIKYLDFFKDLDIIYKEEFFKTDNERALLLCSVRNPSNLGSVIRSAAAFGVEHIILSSDCADVYNPKTVRSAMGSLFKVRITRVKELADFISMAKAQGRRVFAAELREGAKSLKDVGLTPSDIVIIGNEGHGIPESISSICSGSVYIPISQNIESLNASVAAAIFMWEQNK